MLTLHWVNTIPGTVLDEHRGEVDVFGIRLLVPPCSLHIGQVASTILTVDCAFKDQT